jgi:putative membrane protein
MNLRNLIASAAACSSLALSAGVLAQTTQPTPPPTQAGQRGEIDPGDRDFMENAAQAGHAEIEGSKLALSHAKSADVKAFADQMIKDHTKVGEELAALAKSKGYTPPDSPSLAQKAMLKTLDMRDESFDAKYTDSIGVSAHEDAVKLFQAASTGAKDPDIKQFAANNLPALQKHLEMARALQQKVSPRK